MAELSTNVIIAISLGCFIVIVLFCFVLVTIFYRNKLKKFLRRGNLKSAYKPSVEDLDQSISNFDTNPTEINRYEFIKSCANKHENNDKLFIEEFKKLPDYTTLKSAKASNSVTNKYKNRYSNIKAFDHSRVVLSEKNSSDGYINANFVQGFSISKKFIATQGPKPETIIDFWRMISSYKVKAIVMLTNLVENGVVKCNQYWPDTSNKTVTYGFNEVTLIDESVCGDYVLRKFNLVTNNSDKTSTAFTVSHYYYQKWYDRGVPDTNPISILRMIRDVNEHHSQQENPIVVHCSAGVGRTGTYIALDAMLENLNTSENLINIFEFVSKIRMQRCYLVQTLVQYIFIHDALNDYCVYGFTDMKSENVGNTYQNLKHSNNEDNIDSLQIEFDRLNIQKPLLNDTSIALENSDKNRDQNVLCFNHNRTVLSGDHYINATSFLGTFIITQDPMINTVAHFWKLLCEYNSKIIVTINNDFQSQYEEIGWPTSANPCFQFELDNCEYQIKLQENSSDQPVYPSILTKSFKISENNAGVIKESQVTNLIINESWDANTKPSSTKILLDLHANINHYVESYKNPHILIHGHAGGSNCLLVSALFVLLDQFYFENCVDVFNVAKFLNTQRFNVKLNYDQYDHLYKCLTELPLVKAKSLNI